jgi:hypothetical protein
MGEVSTPGAAGESPPAPLEGPTVEAFIASMADEKLRMVCNRIVSFFHSLLPGAVGIVNPSGHGFTMVFEGECLANIYLDQGFLWLEAGPDRIPTGKITDLRALEKVLKRLELLLLNRLERGKVKTP